MSEIEQHEIPVYASGSYSRKIIKFFGQDRLFHELVKMGKGIPIVSRPSVNGIPDPFNFVGHVTKVHVDRGALCATYTPYDIPNPIHNDPTVIYIEPHMMVDNNKNIVRITEFVILCREDIK